MVKADSVPRPRRAVDGVLVLDKPQGMTSNAALQRVKWLFRAKKAGHTGSLDPLATGVLPLCFGEATKFSQYLLDADKTYRAEALLGVVTDSGDADGKVVVENPVPSMSRDEFAEIVSRFTGDLLQVPSMFSALKRDGRPLYELARAGITVEREARSIRITRLALDAYDGSTFAIEAHVSKGTYIRSLVEDIGQAAGCGAHVTSLRRLSAGGFTLAQAITIGQIEAIAQSGGEAALHALLMPPEAMLVGWPVITLSRENAYHTRRGKKVPAGNEFPAGTVVAIHGESGEGREFLGVGEIGDDGLLVIRRLMNTSEGD